MAPVIREEHRGPAEPPVGIEPTTYSLQVERHAARAAPWRACRAVDACARHADRGDGMSAVTERVERLLALRARLDAPFDRAFAANDIDEIDRTLERKRAVTAALVLAVA